MLSLTFLGTSAARPTVERGVSSIAVTREGETFLFECGEGTQRQMMRYGVGFTLSLTFLGGLREIFGQGTIFGQSVMGASFEPFSFMVQAPGAFVCLGLLLGLMNVVEAVRTR